MSYSTGVLWNTQTFLKLQKQIFLWTSAGSLLSCTGCLLLFSASRSSFVTTVTDKISFFFSFRRLLSECEHPVTKRMSKNFSLALYIVQRQLSRWSACPSWWSDAWSCVHLPGHFFSFAYQLTSPTYSQLIAHTVIRLHPLTVRVWLAVCHLMPTLLKQGVCRGS